MYRFLFFYANMKNEVLNKVKLKLKVEVGPGGHEKHADKGVQSSLC